MAFEVLDSPLPFSNLSPARRLVALVFAAAAFLALIWCCVVAHTAKPIEPEQGRSADVQQTGVHRTGLNGTGLDR